MPRGLDMGERKRRRLVCECPDCEHLHQWECDPLVDPNRIGERLEGEEKISQFNSVGCQCCSNECT